MNGSRPDGKLIAEKARGANFDQSKAVSGDVKGGKVTMAPAELHIKDIKDLEDGAVVGQLETTAPGDETPLPPGKYHVYVHKDGGNWQGHAEADGQIVASAARVSVEQHEKGKGPRARVTSEGWCVIVFLGYWGPWEVWVIICW
jgi:hypothetical protein